MPHTDLSPAAATVKTATRRGPSAVLSLAWRAARAPRATTRFTVHDSVKIPMRDGVELDASLYLPDREPQRRVVLIHTPYERKGLAGMHADFLAARGCTVLFVSARGRYGSGGEYKVMQGHGRDATDIVAWMRTQPWWEGTFLTAGGSYMGYTQWALAAEDVPPELIGVAVDCGPHDFAESAVGLGPLRMMEYQSWSRTATIGMKGRKAFEKRTIAWLRENKRGVPPELREAAPWTLEWMAHPNVDDPYWDGYRHSEALEKLNVPVFLTNGWYDIFLAQTLSQWRRFSERGVPVSAQIGPGGHMGSITAVMGEQLVPYMAWLDDVFIGAGHLSRSHPSRVQFGRDKWMEADTWPPNTGTRRWILNADGRLTDRATSQGKVQLTASATDPTPSVGGGHLTLAGGRKDNRALEARPDVLTFTTDPLEQDLWVAGDPSAHLRVKTDAPGLDLFVAVTEVDRRGRSWNVTDGLVRVERSAAHAAETVVVPLIGVAHRFRKGTRIRMQVACAAFPRFDLHPHLLAAGQVTLELDADGDTHLDLPTVSGPGTAWTGRS